MNRSPVTLPASPKSEKPGAAHLPATKEPVSVARGRYIYFFAIALIGCAADLLTKEWVFRWRGMPQPDNVWWLIEDYVGIETAINLGALFGMGHGYSFVFATLSIAAATGVLAWIFYGQAVRELALTISLGCVMAGILGNLYDRLGLWQVPGHPELRIHGVRDWILFRWGEYTWPNFNIADSFLVCGAFLLFLHSFRNPQGDSNQGAPTE